MFKKTTKIVLCAVALAGAIFACAPSAEQIKASAGNLMAVNKQVDSVYTLLNNSYESYQPAAMDKALEDFTVFLSQSQQNIQAMEVLENTTKLREALINKIDVLQHIANSESKEQVRIYKLPDEAFTDELRTQWDGLARNVEKKVKEADKNLNDTYTELLNTLNK
ncbi:MAG: hypothetical protein MJZ61_01620 [Bacteroidales bacterium]|nr:hypothetical protein [Bacteroidales bacterium]